MPRDEKQIEAAARQLCLLRQQEPDEPIQLQPPRHLLSPVPDKVQYVPRWCLAAQEIETHLLVAEAIARAGEPA